MTYITCINIHSTIINIKFMTVTMGKEAGLKLSLAKHGGSLEPKMQGIHKTSTSYIICAMIFKSLWGTHTHSKTLFPYITKN